jgi:TP901 family phage tail tape measure protein
MSKAASTPLLSETIQLDVKVPQKTGLEGLLKQLDQVKRAILEANKAVEGISKTNIQRPVGVEQVLRDIQALQKGKGGPALALDVKSVAKAFSVPVAEMRRTVREMADEMKSARQETFRSAPSAARVVTVTQERMWQNRQKGLIDLLTPTVSSVQAQVAQAAKEATATAVQAVQASASAAAKAVPAEQVKAEVLKAKKGRHEAEQFELTGKDPVKLPIPADRVQASVEGVVKLVIPASQVAAETSGGGGGGTRDPNTGRFVSGGGGGGGGGRKKRGKGGGPLDVPDQPGEFARRRVEAGDQIRETVSRRDASGAIVRETWSNAEQEIIKTVRESATGLAPLQQIKAAKQEYAKRFKLDTTDVRGLAWAPEGVRDDLRAYRALRRQAAGLQGMITPELAKSLGPAQAAHLQNQLNLDAEVLRSEARQVMKESVAKDRTRRERAAEKTEQRTVREQEASLRGAIQEAAHGPKLTRTQMEIWEKTHPDIFRSGAGQTHFFSEMGRSSERSAQLLEKELLGNTKAGAQVRRSAERAMEQHQANAQLFHLTAGGGGPNEPKLSGNAARLAAGLESGFTPLGFAANITKVAGWAAAVGVLYKSIEAVRYSMERFIEVTEMTARLDVVFRKVGGSAQELTGDILKLAAANARDTNEAMESATEWARLGLTRKEVGEVTRVSMAAANVAHMKTTETTKQLSTLMHVFDLQANEMNGVLGMLTATSQRYNVTLEDLFTGLDRSAATAKQAKMTLGELQALIAVMVGRTGQTGIIIGNTIKNILTQFSNPTMQQYLRTRGIETLVTEGENAGQMKSGSQILRDVFVRYAGMKPAEQTDMARNLAGRLQVGRFQSLMEGYVDSQKLAVDTQLQLNAAQEANVKILGTLKAQLTELRVEWDRMASLAGKNAAPFWTEMVRMGKNTMRWATNAGQDERMGAVQELGRRLEKQRRDQVDAWIDEQTKRTGHAPGALWTIYRHSAFQPSLTPIPTPLGPIAPGKALLAFQEWLKRTQETPYERGEEAFQNKVQEQRARANSAMLKARLFETVRDTIKVAGPEMVSSMGSAAASEMSLRDAEAFKAMLSAGNRGAAADMLNQQATAAKKQGVDAAAAENEERTKRLAEAKAALRVVDEQIQKADSEGRSTTDLITRKAELTQAIDANNEARVRNLSFIEEELGKTEQAIFLKQQYVDLLKQQEMVAQSLTTLAVQGNPDSMGVRLDAQVGALRDEVALLEAQRDRLEQHARDVGTPQAEQAKEAIQKELSEKRAQLAAQDSPQMRQLAAVYDARAIAERRAHAEASTWGVGYTEGGKLAAEEKRLQDELAQLRARQKGGVSDNEAVRAKQLEIELTHTQEQIQMRLLDLARQERQIRLDAIREFNKGLLLSGPGELLQRLQVSQLMHRNVSAGEFFSLSPEVRRMYFEARGGEAGMNNRLERRELVQAGWARPRTVEEEQMAQAAGRVQIDHWNSQLRRNALGSLTGLPDMHLPDVARGARAVTDSLLVMQGGVLTVTDALARLYQVVESLNRGGGAPSGGRRYDVRAGGYVGMPIVAQPTYQWSR